MRVRTMLAVVAFPLLAAFTWPTQTPRAASTKSEQHTMLQIRNDNWNTVDVYIFRSGMTFRLGTVVTGQTGHFALPADFEQASGDLRLLVEPIGSLDAYITDPLVFSPGQTIQLDVRNQLSMTSYSVRS